MSKLNSTPPPPSDPENWIDGNHQPQRRSERDKVFTMNAVPAAEFDAATYTLTYLIDGILVANQPAILAGKMKTLKTSVLVAMAVALVMARKFLGVFNVPRACRVGFVSCESGLGVLQETFRRVCLAYGCSLGDLAGLVVSDTIPRLEDLACIDALEAFCTDHELEVLILDPAYLMMSGADAGNLLLMGERLALLNRLTARTGVTTILAHHLRKNRASDRERFDPPDLEEIAWSGFAEFARQWLLLGRRSEYEDGTGHHELWLRAGGSAGHNGIWGIDVDEGRRSDPGGRTWDVIVAPVHKVTRAAKKEEARVDRKHEQEETDQRVVIEAMSKLERGEGAFPRKLRALTGISSHERLDRLIVQLTNQGILEPCESLQSSHHKAPKPGAYRLTEDWWHVD